MQYLKLKCYNYYANSHKQTRLYNFQLNAILLIGMHLNALKMFSIRPCTEHFTKVDYVRLSNLLL